MISIALIALGIGLTILYFLQDKLVFFPRKYETGDSQLAQGYKILEFSTDSNGSQRAYYRGPEKGLPEKLWLMTGGNGSLALEWEFIVRKASEKNPGNGYLLVEYPGYGMCSGSPSRTGIRQNVELAVQALAEVYACPAEELKRRTSFLGHSLGAAVALETAADWKRGEAVVLSPFTALKEMAARTVGRPLSHLARNRWDNRASLKRIAAMPDVKVLIFHGTKDRVIPFSMGKELAGIVPSTEFVAVEGAGHNDIVWEVRERLVEELSR